MPEADELIRNLKRLNGKSITIVAAGKYPVKAQTPVQDVAVYQNNGTDKITPAKFVEKAERQNQRKWKRKIDEAVCRFLFGDDFAMDFAADEIAEDINKAVNRIDTGRLKKSMEGHFE